MRQYKSPSITLFDQLGAGLDVLGQVEVPKYHRYQNEDAAQGEIAPAQIVANSLQPNPMESLPENMTDMKFTHSLIKHLDQLYSRMLAGEISDINNQSDVNEETIDIAGVPHTEKHSYYNPGNSNVTESM